MPICTIGGRVARDVIKDMMVRAERRAELVSRHHYYAFGHCGFVSSAGGA